MTHAATYVLSALLGIASWSLLEYCIHRWLGHDRRFIKNPFGAEHTAHHSRGNYFAPWYRKAAAAGAVSLVVTPLALLIGGVGPGLVYVAGLLGFYVAYEVLHRREHMYPGIGAYGRWARRHHFYHHFHNPRANHGVTTPIWDHVFGTYARPEMIRVPEKLAMHWLVDPATGDVFTEHATRYALRRGKPRASKKNPPAGGVLPETASQG
jgi:sterol desaturase/sphingolipid hydroxylase (fatty acid hydroxylase superfamily)